MLFLLQKKEDLTTVGQLYGMCLKKLARVIGIWLPGWYYSGPRALEFTVFSAWWGDLHQQARCREARQLTLTRHWLRSATSEQCRVTLSAKKIPGQWRF